MKNPTDYKPVVVEKGQVWEEVDHLMKTFTILNEEEGPDGEWGWGTKDEADNCCLVYSTFLLSQCRLVSLPKPEFEASNWIRIIKEDSRDYNKIFRIVCNEGSGHRLSNESWYTSQYIEHASEKSTLEYLLPGSVWCEPYPGEDLRPTDYKMMRCTVTTEEELKFVHWKNSSYKHNVDYVLSHMLMIKEAPAPKEPTQVPAKLPPAKNAAIHLLECLETIKKSPSYCVLVTAYEDRKLDDLTRNIIASVDVCVRHIEDVCELTVGHERHKYTKLKEVKSRKSAHKQKMVVGWDPECE